ncbi:MAG: hypothetical protein ACK5PI_06685, partial [Acetobacteraceae bacterium]
AGGGGAGSLARGAAPQGRVRGLGRGRAGAERMGQRVRIFDSVRGGDLEAVVCPPVFVDQEGVRSRG